MPPVRLSWMTSLKFTVFVGQNRSGIVSTVITVALISSTALVLGPEFSFPRETPGFLRHLAPSGKNTARACDHGASVGVPGPHPSRRGPTFVSRIG